MWAAIRTFIDLKILQVPKPWQTKPKHGHLALHSFVHSSVNVKMTNFMTKFHQYNYIQRL